MPQIAKRVMPFGTTIFTEINQLAAQYNAVNLGQGKPDFDGPPEAVQAFIDALQQGGHNQYAPGPGAPAARQGVANHAEKHYGLTVDPDQGVVMTPGATEAVFASIMGLVDAGDEVIIIQPFFDSYVPGVLMAGATPVFVSLHAPDWTFDEAELRAAFNERTRAIIINTPHNPTGRVFTREELALIAELCQQYDVTVISDEVYEHLVFGDNVHIPIATLPGMFERTVTIGSAGKTFGMTGWKIGWAYGDTALIKGVWSAHQYIAFATNHPAQLAVAHAFKLGDDYYANYRAVYEGKRQRIMAALDGAGISYTAPQGTYFVMGDFSAVFDGDDIAFSRYAVAEIGVAVIPPTTFYHAAHRHLGQNHVRFSFAKHDEQIDEAARRLARLKQ
ncbi:MAG: aminotransferase class I/II-fold pyridoxal phosphate-dependent enzyme [Anaerolineaceae bacterium]|nr:MAG: aminotransferase class I/II-fold pyridoxal phosphate-dependent enzyme [Anaerolineaceae bacterium]